MQRILQAIGQLSKRLLIVVLMGMLSVSSVFVFANQPALADKLTDKPLNRPSQSEAVLDRAYTLSEGTGLKEESRQEAYEEAAQAINDPKGLDKIYEEDLKAYKEEQPDQGVVESAKEFIQDITGKD